MKLSPFTLIYEPGAELEEPLTAKPRSASSASAESSTAVKGLDDLKPNLSRTLTTSALRQHYVNTKQDPQKQLKTVLKDLNRSEKVVTVALWDLDARVAGLPFLMEKLNSAQAAFTFFDLRAPIPAGLVINSGVFAKWARKRLGKVIPKDEQSNIENNFMFNDFLKFAQVVRQRIGVDYLVGITRFMLAWEENDDVYWNYFSVYEGRIAMVSAFEMRDYAQQAHRPVEVAIAGVAIAQLLAMLNKKISFHENRQDPCVFDFNEDRESIVKALKTPRIDPDCLEKLDQPYRDAAPKMIELFKKYTSPVEQPIKLKTTGKTKKDDKYWLKQLKSLGDKVMKGKL